MSKGSLCPVRRPDLPRDVWVLSIIAFLVAVGFGVLVPVLPVFAKTFEVNNFAVGAVVAAFALMRLVTAPWCARINRLIGERVALALGIAVVAASSAAAGLADSYLQLLVMRGLGGVGSAMFTVAAMSLLLGSVDAGHRGRASAIWSGGFLLGGMAGPAVGGLFAGISLTAPFFFYAGTLTVAATVGLVMLSRPTAHEKADTGRRGGTPLREAIGDLRYQAACFTNFAAGWQSQGARSTLVPLLVTETLAKPASWTGVLFAIAAVVQGLALAPVGRRVDILGRRAVMVASGLVTGVASIAIGWSPNVVLLTLALCVFSLGAAMQSTAPTAVVGDVAPRGGQPIAVFQMSSDLGSIAGPLVAGALADLLGVPIAFMIGAVLLFASAAYSFAIPGQREDDHVGATAR